MGIEHEGEILLTSAEAASHLEVSHTTVTALRRKGVLTERPVPDKHPRYHYVTLMSVLAYHKAEKVTLRELAARVLAIEERLDNLAIRGSAETPKHDGAAQAVLTHHPHLPTGQASRKGRS